MKTSYYGMALILLAGVLSGCMAGFSGSNSHTVRQANPIDLVKDPPGVQALWKTEDLSLSYTRSFEKNRLQINGKIILADKLTHFTTMDHLQVWIHFVDSDSRIIGTRILYTAPRRRWLDLLNLDVHRSMPVPRASVALAFSYSGEVSDGLGDNGDRISWNFFSPP